MTAKKRILVTGGAGYIGSHMVLSLLDAGESPVVLDNLSTGVRSAVPHNVPFYKGSCGDADLVGAIIREQGIATIVHFAASIIVAESVADPLRYYANNTVNSRALIEAAVRHGVSQFIFSSTAAVYGEPEIIPIREESPTSPINPYGRSKLAIEWMLADTAKIFPLKYCALRYFNVAGADPAGRSGQSSPIATHLIKIAVQAALGSRAGMDVFGTDYKTPDGSCIRDYVHVSDLAEAHMCALRYLRGGGDNVACNIGYEHGYSVLEVVDVVKQVSGVDFDVRLKGRRGGDPAVLVAANERAKSLLGWKPRYDDLPEMVRHALAWEKKLIASGHQMAK